MYPKDAQSYFSQLCSLQYFHYSPNLETTYMPFNRRMNKENGVHLHNGALLSREKQNKNKKANNDIVSFACNWVKLGKKSY